MGVSVKQYYNFGKQLNEIIFFSKKADGSYLYEGGLYGKGSLDTSHNYQNCVGGYLGFQFKAKDGKTEYGWLRAVGYTNLTLSTNKDSLSYFKIIEMAYNTVPNEDILTGQKNSLTTDLNESTELNLTEPYRVYNNTLQAKEALQYALYRTDGVLIKKGNLDKDEQETLGPITEGIYVLKATTLLGLIRSQKILLK